MPGKKKRYHVNDLLTGDGLKEVLKGTDDFAVDMVFPFSASFIDRCMGIGASCDFTQMNVQCADIVTKVPVDHREVRWKERKLSKLRSQTEKFKRVITRVAAPHCTSGLYTLSLSFFNHLVRDLDRSGSKQPTDVASFKLFNVSIRQPYRKTSQKISARVEETTQDMKSACAECKELSIEQTEIRVELLVQESGSAWKIE